MKSTDRCKNQYGPFAGRLRFRATACAGNAPRDVAIIIDASASMAYRKSGAPVWYSAIETATTIVD